ncbi:hypothetical protein EBR57_05530 [bacterium]|nr:hypothetical protein [bacterium]
MIKLRPTVALRQQLKLSQILSPKMIQMLKTFSLSYSDMMDRVTRDVDENVVLEVVQYDRLTDYAASRRNSLATESSYDVGDLARSKSDSDQLHSFLMAQLGLCTLSDGDEAIAKALILHIDDRGYISDYDQIKAQLCRQFDIDDRKLLSVLRMVQKLEPDGVGARSLKECLLIQIDNHHFEHDRLAVIFKRVVSHHLDDLGAGRYDQIAAALEIDVDGVSAIADFIRLNLNPNPGLAYGGSDTASPIIPSFEVRLEGDHIDLIHLEQTMGVQLGVSARYLKMLSDPAIDAETRTYIEERVQKANDLIDMIRNRQRLMRDLVERIVQRQSEFLKRGLLYLVPLLQKELAEALRMSPSTISRIVASKYIVTPHGTFSLKQLCPRNHFGLTSVRLGHLIMGVFDEFQGVTFGHLYLIYMNCYLPIILVADKTTQRV